MKLPRIFRALALLTVGAACVILGGLCAIVGLTDMAR